VTRAGLIWELALMLGARQLDPRLAYMTAPERVDTPLARAYAVESWMPFNLKRLQARLRSLGAGRVEVHRRGAPIEPAELERQLRQEGSARRLVFLTRLRGRMIAIICHDARRPGPSQERGF
jgi:THUMP domain-like